jgi:hypothetical protein
MQTHDPPGNRQPDAGAARRFAINPVEALKDQLELVRFDAAATISHQDFADARLAPSCDFNTATSGSV